MCKPGQCAAGGAGERLSNNTGQGRADVGVLRGKIQAVFVSVAVMLWRS